MRNGLMLLLTMAAALAIPATASAELGAPFATVSKGSTCENGATDTQPVARPDLMYRLTIPEAASTRWYPVTPAYSSGLAVVGPSVTWAPGDPISAGGTGEWMMTCGNVSSPYTVEAYTVPSTPATFSGHTQPTSSFVAATGSYLTFRAPGTAQFSAEVSVSQGAVSVSSSATAPRIVASSASVDLGTLTGGVHEVSIQAEDGPDAIWSVRIVARPVVVSAASFTPREIEAGDLARFTYTLNSDADVVARIQRDGELVRPLYSGRVLKGTRTFLWDGTTASNSKVPPGTYQLRIDATGMDGTTTSPLYPLTVLPGERRTISMQGIGDITIGQTRPQVERRYGMPTRTYQLGSRGGWLTASYLRDGHRISVDYLQGRVIWIQTNSPFYRTVQGLHIGSLVPAPRAAPFATFRFRPDPYVCGSRPLILQRGDDVRTLARQNRVKRLTMFSMVDMSEYRRAVSLNQTDWC